MTDTTDREAFAVLLWDALTECNTDGKMACVFHQHLGIAHIAGEINMNTFAGAVLARLEGKHPLAQDADHDAKKRAAARVVQDAAARLNEAINDAHTAGLIVTLHFEHLKHFGGMAHITTVEIHQNPDDASLT